MFILKLITYPYTFIKKKYELYKKEEHKRLIYKKYGSLTKYYVNTEYIRVGDYTYGIPNIVNYTDKPYKISIGNFCSISNNLEIIIGGQHNYKNISSYSFLPQVQEIFPDIQHPDKPIKNVVIGNDVWIGRNVTILQGVTIGDGAVIGTNSVVAKDIPPYAIAIGNPVKIIKYRFNEHQIEALLRIKWWDWPLDILKERMKEIINEDIDGFIAKYDPREA